MNEKKLRRKIIAEVTALQEVIKHGISNEQTAKVADRFKKKHEQDASKTRKAALEEQVEALAKSPAAESKKACQRRQTRR